MDQRTASSDAATGLQDEPTIWRCPVCTITVPHPRRPGRARVYCTNSCKQRAYRWRRRHRHEISSPMPPERAHTYDRTHAVRSDDDFTSQQRTRCRFGQPRRLTACGTFAAAANEATRQMAHTKFYASAADHDAHLAGDTTCRSCVALLGVPVEPLAAILERLKSSVPPSRSENR